MPDDETVCGETEADVARHQVKILERRIAELEATLAESQAREAKLREALEESRRISREAVIAWASTLSVGADGALRAIERAALAALALKADNAALVEVCERVVDACAREIDPYGAQLCLANSKKKIVARVLGGGAK